MSTRLVVSKVVKGRKLIKDIPRISLDLDSSEAELDESEDEELESYSDPTYAPDSGSEDEAADVEASSSDVEEADDASLETEQASPDSSLLYSERRAAEEAPLIAKPEQLESYHWEDFSSTIPWVSHGDVIIDKMSPSSGPSSSFEEDVLHPEIGEGFDRVRDLVDELLSVEKSCEEIEANAEFVHGLLRKLSDHVADNCGDVGDEGAEEEKAPEDKTIFVDKKALKKEVWLTKCDSKMVDSNQVVDSRKESKDLISLLHHPPITFPPVERSPLKSDLCQTAVSTTATQSPDSPTLSLDDEDEMQDCLSQASSDSDTESSNPVPPVRKDSLGDLAATEPKAGEKSKYEMIREEIIAERNAQLKAMGFFEEFAALRSDMNPSKKLKIKKKKKQHQFKDLFEKDRVRRSERLFLSSPDVDLPEVNNKATDAVVTDVLQDIIHAVSQEKVLPNLDEKINICSDCGKRFKMRRYLAKHTKSVHGKLLTIACEHCDFKTERSRSLTKHLANQHSEIWQTHHTNTCSEIRELDLEVLGCDQCSYVTSKKRNLRCHKLKVHEKNRDQPYRCDLCDYVTPYKSFMLRHQAAYHNVRKRFEGEEGIGVKVHMCNQCNFVTKHRASLSKHKTRHHAKAIPTQNMSIVESNLCGPQFMDLAMATVEVVDSDLESVEIFTDDSDQEEDEVIKRAESIVNGAKMTKNQCRWSCDICSKVLSSRSNLQRHTIKVHNKSA